MSPLESDLPESPLDLLGGSGLADLPALSGPLVGSTAAAGGGGFPGIATLMLPEPCPTTENVTVAVVPPGLDAALALKVTVLPPGRIVRVGLPAPFKSHPPGPPLIEENVTW